MPTSKVSGILAGIGTAAALCRGSGRPAVQAGRLASCRCGAPIVAAGGYRRLAQAGTADGTARTTSVCFSQLPRRAVAESGRNRSRSRWTSGITRTIPRTDSNDNGRKSLQCAEAPHGAATRPAQEAACGSPLFFFSGSSKCRASPGPGPAEEKCETVRVRLPTRVYPYIYADLRKS